MLNCSVIYIAGRKGGISYKAQAVAYCWFMCRTRCVRSAWPASVVGENLGTFANPLSFSTGVSEVMRQDVGNNPSTILIDIDNLAIYLS